MNRIMNDLREDPIKEINGIGVKEVKDYLSGIDGLPKSDVLKYFFEDGSTVVIRPSGTEPKLKLYISAINKDTKELSKSFKGILN